MKKTGPISDDLSKQELQGQLERDVAKFFAEGGEKTVLKPEKSNLCHYRMPGPSVVSG